LQPQWHAKRSLSGDTEQAVPASAAASRTEQSYAGIGSLRIVW
jgi:hypothetical protein